ncbi:hypothetical protein F5B18DRAFT_621600 [Nemania serpens]|nr:hypothetical protein F5B18DRAFT_621600 [Nemania serpens]
MPAAKHQRRAVAASSKTKTSQQHASSSISSFARVSKTVGHANAKKELSSSPVTPKKAVNLEAITPASRKRKIVASVEEDSSADEGPKKLKRKLTLAAASSTTKSTTSTTASTTTTTTTATPTQPVKRGRGRPPKKPRPEAPTPRKRARSPSVSDSDVSSIDAGALFKKLRLESSPSRSCSPLTADTSLAGSDVELDAKQPPVRSGQLPEEVLSLIALHTAFLKTVTLHYAHHGSATPVDLRVLCPNMARAWGKKKVTDADVRVCLGVLGEPLQSPSTGSSSSTSTGGISSPFRLSNYGRGKICVEIDPDRNPGPLNENKLNALFRTNISALWTRFLVNGDGNGNADVSATTFLTTLPMAPVTLCESVVKASPILLKGQQRLEDLKHSITMKRQERNSKATPTTTTVTTATPAEAPKLSLLDRIRLKSQQKSALPPGLSPAQQARRAALQRVEEVSALVAMLSRAASDSDSGRVSFAMAALLEKLKDSFRMGISKPEGAACVRLLAAEVAPEWVRVVTLSGREHVVVEMTRQIGKGEVAGRVRGILERE